MYAWRCKRCRVWSIRGRGVVLIVALLTVLLSTPGVRMVGAAPDPAAEVAALPVEARLKSSDPAVAAQAVKNIKNLTDEDLEGTIDNLQESWLEVLMNAQHYDLAEDLALWGILAAPHDSRRVEYFQEIRVHALLGAGKYPQALACAKGLFNVCAMRRTENALLLVAECLKLAHPEERGIVDRFRREQVAGAALAQQTTQPAVVSTILAGIAIDPGAYDQAIKKIDSTDEDSELGKANLLLLAGRAEEAGAIFAALLQNANTLNLTGYHANIARGLKAQDGVIGRANAYAVQASKERN